MSNRNGGFSSMDQDKQRKVASKGGKASQKNRTTGSSKSDRTTQSGKTTKQQP